jgi:hypothetical protein
MLAILHLLAMFVPDLFKPRRQLEVENLFLRHQLNICYQRMRSSPANWATGSAYPTCIGRGQRGTRRSIFRVLLGHFSVRLARHGV